MKRIAILCIGEPTGSSLAADFRTLFGAYTEVDYHIVDGVLDLDPGKTLAVATGVFAIKPHVERLCRAGLELVVAQRSPNHRNLGELLSLRAGTSVLLVNDHQDTAESAIRQLRSLGIDHLDYHAWYPGLAEYPRLETAVTPGESHFVPPCATRVIDIGIRSVDVSTYLEVARRLGLMESLGETISSWHIREIVGLLRRINASADEAISMRDALRIIADCSGSGIALTDCDGKVVTANRSFRALAGPSCHEGESLLLGSLLGADVPDEIPVEGLLRTVGGAELLVRRRSVSQSDGRNGYVYSFEDRSVIEGLDIEIRRQARRSEHVARYGYADIATVSPRMRETIELSKRLAASDSTILIQGESGTGKELLAQAIHNVSPRRDGPFVPVNLAALSGSLLESELFGYEEGSFTGAKRGGSRGLFEEAHGGTLFLDEVGDAQPDIQVRLLRALQERQIRRVGGSRQIPVDVRVIAATNRDLAADVRIGRFREDLYYRLNVLPLRTPPLRERPEDLSHLMNRFVARFSRGVHDDVRRILDPAAIELLLGYHWPGNIRELINVVDYIVQIHRPGEALSPERLPVSISASYGRIDASRLSAPGYGTDGQDPGNEGLEALLGERASRILGIIVADGPMGRGRLAEVARETGFELSDGDVRGILADLARRGLVESGAGRRGSWATSRARRLLEE